MKICDFGLSFQCGRRICPSIQTVVNYGLQQQTLWFRAPEVLLGYVEYARPADVWSLAVVMLNMVGSDCPFQARGQYELLVMIFRVLGTPDESTWPGFSDRPLQTSFPQFHRQCIAAGLSAVHPTKKKFDFGTKVAHDFVSRVLLCYPGARLTAHGALQHPYLRPALQLHGKS